MGSLVKEYSEEKLFGKVYTPKFIVKKILDDVGFYGEKILEKKILDPACGDGRFLEEIVMRIIEVSSSSDLKKNLLNVYGWDINPLAIEQCREKLNDMLHVYGLNINWNLEVCNALEKIFIHDELFSSPHPKFDFIVGNPPYIRIQHLEKKQRKFIQQQYSYCKSGSTDIYIAFFELAYSLLNNNGTCGFITPNTYFYTETAKTFREKFAIAQNIVQITNYGPIQLFDDVTTYSAITIFNSKENKDFLFQQAIDRNKFTEIRLGFDEIRNKKIWQLTTQQKPNFNGTKMKKLKDIARISVGITTLCDKAYIFNVCPINKKYVWASTRLKGMVQLEKALLKPIIKASRIPESFKKNEFILFPYKKVKGKYQIIPEEELKKKFPYAYQYLHSIKNILDKRDNGKPNPVSWYAFGRSQGLNSSFGKKILFSPMNNKPRFMLSERTNATFYSGYCIKFNGNCEKLLTQLNSKQMQDFIAVSGRDFRGGWKAYNKKTVEEFEINTSLM